MNVNWFTAYSGQIDEALAYLPESEMFSRALNRRLLSMPRREALKIALVSEHGVPVAVMGLVKRNAVSLEPMTNWLVPGSVFTVAPGRRVDAAAALNRELGIAWWRMEEALPAGPLIHALETVPVHVMADLAGREEFWRSTGLLGYLKRARDRTRHLEVKIGVPEVADQIITGWRRRWAGGDGNDDLARSRKLIAEELEPLGKHVTMGLFDHGTLVAGQVNFIHRNALVAGLSYLSPEYRRLAAGVRLIDEFFNYAQERGLKEADIGGGARYKAKWAPPGGTRAFFIVANPRLRAASQLARSVKRAFVAAAPPVGSEHRPHVWI